MLEGTGSHLGHRTGEAGAAALGQHQAMGAESLGAAHDRAEIVRIGDAVEGHQQRRFAQVAAAIDQGAEVEGVGCSRLQHDALVHGTIGELAEACPGDLLHQNATGLGLAQQLQETRLKAQFRCAPDAMDRPIALQCRLGSMAPPDQIIGRACLEAFGFTSGNLHGDRPSTLAGQIPASISGIAAVGTATIAAPVAAALTTTVALSAFGATGGAAALAQLGPTQGATSTEGRAALGLSAAEGATPFTAACIGTAGIRAARVGTTAIRTALGPAGAGTGTVAAGAIEAGTVRAGTIEARSLRAGAIETALRAPLAFRTLRTPLTTGLERPWPTEGSAGAGPRALALVPSTIKTGAHGRQADGLWVGVLKSIQQLSKPTGVPQKQPANHCLKSCGSAIDPRFPATGAPASPVAPLPYQL